MVNSPDIWGTITITGTSKDKIKKFKSSPAYIDPVAHYAIAYGYPSSENMNRSCGYTRKRPLQFIDTGSRFKNDGGRPGLRELTEK